MLSRLNSLLRRKLDPSTKDGLLDVYAAAAPTASKAGFATGCLWHDLADAKLYINTGTLGSSAWTEVGAGGDYITSSQLPGAVKDIVGSSFITYGGGDPSATPSTGPGSIYADVSSGKVYIYTAGGPGGGGWTQIGLY